MVINYHIAEAQISAFLKVNFNNGEIFMNDGTGIKWAKRMTIIFGCSALGVAAGAISTTFNQSFPEYMQDAIDNNPALLEMEAPYHQNFYVWQEATNLRTADNLQQTGLGLAAGLCAGLLTIGIGGATSAFRKPQLKPS